jgi:hypothetical protein
MPTYEVRAHGWLGRSIFDPRLQGQRRIYTLEADSEAKVRELFAEAVAAKDSHVMSEVGPFVIESIKEIDDTTEGGE